MAEQNTFDLSWCRQGKAEISPKLELEVAQAMLNLEHDHDYAYVNLTLPSIVADAIETTLYVKRLQQARIEIDPTGQSEHGHDWKVLHQLFTDAAIASEDAKEVLIDGPRYFTQN